MHRVRWVFTEGSETFQVELRHGPRRGSVNRQRSRVTHLVRDQAERWRRRAD